MKHPLRALSLADFFPISISALALLAGCATAPSPQEVGRLTQAALKSSFRDQGAAKLDRLEQDALQQACSGADPPSDALAAQLAAAQLASVQWPADGVYLGDWREGEKLAQNGRGMTWTDAAGTPNGGSCYNCHRISGSEISYGTLGPSLYRYGKLRGVANPLDAQAAPVVRYTWGKLWNSKAYNACSGMPRFGHAGVLTPAQIRDLMALLLDPASPVNAQ